MKRVFVIAGFVLAALFILSGSGTEAVNNSFAEHFIVDGKTIETGESGTYKFDKAHSFIGFKVRHNGLIEVPGFFRDFTGSVNYDAKDVSRSTVEFTAKATSVDTGVGARDNHLRTADFFEVEKYPDITFKSTSVAKKGKGWVVTGDFTMKGVTRSISFPFQIAGFLPTSEKSPARMGITAETSINRRDYGVNYTGAKLASGLFVVDDNVKIVLQIEAAVPKTPVPKAE